MREATEDCGQVFRVPSCAALLNHHEQDLSQPMGDAPGLSYIFNLLKMVQTRLQTRLSKPSTISNSIP